MVLFLLIFIVSPCFKRSLSASFWAVTTFIGLGQIYRPAFWVATTFIGLGQIFGQLSWPRPGFVGRSAIFLWSRPKIHVRGQCLVYKGWKLLVMIQSGYQIEIKGIQITNPINEKSSGHKRSKHCRFVKTR